MNLFMFIFIKIYLFKGCYLDFVEFILIVVKKIMVISFVGEC